MNKSSRVSLAPLAALLLAGSALAQTVTNPDADRADRHCTSATLAADSAAACSGDVLNVAPGVVTVVARPPGVSALENGNANAATTSQAGPGITGTVSTGAMGNMGTPGVSAGGSALAPARK